MHEKYLKSLWLGLITVITICIIVSSFGNHKQNGNIRQDESIPRTAHEKSCQAVGDDNEEVDVVMESTFPGGSIMFNENGNHKHLSPKELCAIESALKNNPTKQVALIPSMRNSSLKINRGLKRIMIAYKEQLKFFHIKSILQMARGTPIQTWLEKNDFTAPGTKVNPRHLVSSITDLLKFLELYHHGGSVLDTDVIIIKSTNTCQTLQTWRLAGESTMMRCSSTRGIQSWLIA